MNKLKNALTAIKNLFCGKKNGDTSKKVHKKNADLLFCIGFAALPLLQFSIFYVYVNLNSVLLSFQTYSLTDGYGFAGFSNFAQVFEDLVSLYEVRQSAINSLLLFAITLLVSTPLCLLFANYIYKKCFGWRFAKIVIFMPSIISGIVFVTLYVHITDSVIPAAIKAVFNIKIRGLLANIETRLGTIFFYSVWCGFGSTVIIYSSTMSGISPSVVEAGELDGITPFKEFIYITLPLVYPTCTLFISVSVTSIFLNQAGLFSFYGDNASPKISTLGYFLYKGIYKNDKTMFPYLSAMGVIFTIIAVPLVYGVKALMVKLGPSED